MVSMVACHARDRGSNPGGPKAFSLQWQRGNLVRGVVMAILHCMVYVRLLPGSAPKDKRGKSVVTRPYPEILTASLLG